MATPMQLERRSRLVALLRRVPADAFRMRRYVSVLAAAMWQSATPHKSIFQRLRSFIDRRKPMPTHCDTAGCAAGWAAVIWPSIFDDYGSYQPERLERLLGLTPRQSHAFTHNGWGKNAKQKARQLASFK